MSLLSNKKFRLPIQVEYVSNTHSHIPLLIKGACIAGFPLVIILSRFSPFTSNNASSLDVIHRFLITIGHKASYYLRGCVPLYRNVRNYIMPRANLYRTYASREAEDAYWAQAAKAWRALSFSDARFTGSVPGANRKSRDRSKNIQKDIQVLYYVPRMLPEYRDAQDLETEIREYNISTRTLTRWHRLVFPERAHPTHIQAEKMMKRFSNRDLHEIFRISRSVTDVDDEDMILAGRRGATGERKRKQARKHKVRWQRWLENKGPDLVIIFENE